MPSIVYKTIKVSAFFIALIISQVYIISCRNNESDKRPVEASEVKEPLIKANKQALQLESQQIEDFIKRYKWKMNETGSGLLYMVYQQGTGSKIETGNLVEMAYAVTLLTGDTIYSSAEKGNLLFYAGKAQVISGLEEGILLLRQGDRAKFIIPSHLAFGLIGDQDKIGSKTTLVYDVEVLRIKK